MTGTDLKSFNPLASLWKWLSVPLGVIGLAGLGDSLIKWKGFILELIQSYQSLVHPMWEFLFGWLPWGLPSWAADYLTLSVIVASSAAKGSEIPEVSLGTRIVVRSLFIAIAIVMWPLMNAALLYAIYRTEGRNKRARSEMIGTMQWMGAILLGFVILLTINSALLD